MGSQEVEARELPEFRGPGNWEVVEVRKSGRAELPEPASPAHWEVGALRGLGIPKFPGARELEGREFGIWNFAHFGARGIWGI